MCAVQHLSWTGRALCSHPRAAKSPSSQSGTTADQANVELIEGNDVSGILGIKTHWPSMVRTVYGDHNRFMNTCECR